MLMCFALARNIRFLEYLIIVAAASLIVIGTVTVDVILCNCTTL